MSSPYWGPHGNWLRKSCFFFLTTNPTEPPLLINWCRICPSIPYYPQRIFEKISLKLTAIAPENIWDQQINIIISILSQRTNYTWKISLNSQIASKNRFGWRRWSFPFGARLRFACRRWLKQVSSVWRWSVSAIWSPRPWWKTWGSNNEEEGEFRSFTYFFIFTPIYLRKIPILTNIFFR